MNKITKLGRYGIALLAILLLSVALIGCDSNTSLNTGTGSDPVELGAAGDYVLLAKTGISTVPNSVITGDVGLSPEAESSLTGFSQTDATGYATSAQVTGRLYAADMASPTPSNLTTAVSNMETAYTAAAGRVGVDELNLGAGEIGGLTLVPGLYKWDSAVTISTDVTLSGNSTDVWIFQISGNLTMASAKSVILSGGASAENIIWQVAGFVTLGSTAHFEGIVLCQTNIAVGNLATVNGRLFAQTEISLDQATVTQP
ncbi:MAG: ice-binding family protein [Sphaerochaeta sp.]|nr:ice-binding family protein [Sphaerochaeta sp.]